MNSTPKHVLLYDALGWTPPFTSALAQQTSPRSPSANPVSLNITGCGHHPSRAAQLSGADGVELSGG